MSRRLTSRPLDCAKLQGTLAEICDLGDGVPPRSLVGSFDAAGNCRRLKAAYPNGWEVRVNLSVAKGGQLTVSSYSASLRMRGEVRK